MELVKMLLILDFIKENYGWIVGLAGFIFVLGKYKALFDAQAKSFAEHELRVERQFDKRDQVIEEIVKRVENINTEFTFMKGWIAGKNH